MESASARSYEESDNDSAIIQGKVREGIWEVAETVKWYR